VLEALKKIEETRIVSIIRNIPKEHLISTIDALYKGGIRCIEITMDSPNALEMIALAKATYKNDILIGAGTVLDEMTARSVILAGAEFVLSPTLSTKVIEVCNTYGKLAIPGVFTPTEALTATQAGAQIVKVFPVSSVGPNYIKDLKGPLSQIRLMPVGGVDEKNAKAYLESGAIAIGIGSCLVSQKDVLNGNFEKITSRAKALVQEVK